MKKMFWMLGVAVAALTSCTSDEVVEVNSNVAIDFSTFVGKGTRSVTPTDGNLNQFYVFGYYGPQLDKVAFNNNVVTKNVPTDVTWTANNYSFAAYANKNSSDALNATFIPTTNTLTISGFTVSESVDLVAALARVDNSNLGNETVDLTFNHMLSKVKFTIRNTAENLTMKVSDIVVTGLTDKGTCTYSTSGISWEELTATNDYKITYKGTTTDIPAPTTVDNNTTYSSYESEEFLVIPQDLTNIIAEFTIQFFDANGKVDEIVFEGNDAVSLNAAANSVTAWQGGVVYNYCTDMPASPNKIVFNVEKVNGWPNPTDLDDSNGEKPVEF